MRVQRATGSLGFELRGEAEKPKSPFFVQQRHHRFRPMQFSLATQSRVVLVDCVVSQISFWCTGTVVQPKIQIGLTCKMTAKCFVCSTKMFSKSAFSLAIFLDLSFVLSSRSKHDAFLIWFIRSSHFSGHVPEYSDNIVGIQVSILHWWQHCRNTSEEC